MTAVYLTKSSLAGTSTLLGLLFPLGRRGGAGWKGWRWGRKKPCTCDCVHYRCFCCCCCCSRQPIARHSNVETEYPLIPCRELAPTTTLQSNKGDVPVENGDLLMAPREYVSRPVLVRQRRSELQKLVAIVPEIDVAPSQAQELGKPERLPAHVLAHLRRARDRNHMPFGTRSPRSLNAFGRLARFTVRPR